MYDGPIIDSHHHIWEWENYPWLTAPMTPKMFGDDYSGLRQDYLVDDLKADFGDNNIVKSVHVQANYDPSDPVGETTWLQGVADRSGFPHGIVGFVDMTDPGAEEAIQSHRRYKNFRGVRQQLHYWEGDPLRCSMDRADLCLMDTFQDNIDLLGKYDLHFELQGFAHQFAIFAELASNHPDTKFCLVHAGMLTADDPQTVQQWKEGLSTLKPLDNVWIKCSGLNFFTGKCDIDHMSIVIDHVLDQFGAGRCFYGSNFPLEKLWTSYGELISANRRILEKYPPEVQRSFFHDTAAAFYRI